MSEPLRILLIMPDARIHRIRLGRRWRSMREAPLTLTTLAALAPPELKIDFALVDESIDALPTDADFDLVGISALTGTAPRAYELARHFRRRGVPVVLGGVHVTLLPDEAARHADSIVVGMGEDTWPRLLRDAACGRLRARYDSELSPADSLRNLPRPRTDLQRAGGYMMPQTVMATRGCTNGCAFCSVPAVWRGFATRPVGDVVADVRSRPGRLFAFSDVNLTADRDYARELFTALIPLKRRWGGLATVDIADDPELLDLMARSGCRYLLVGFESMNARALGEIRKGFNGEDRYADRVAALHAHGISVQGCFIFGFDHDDPGVFDATVQRVSELKIDIPRYSLFTPYPGTSLFRRLDREGRILSRDWSDYDTMHVVFEPARMSPDALYAGFKRAYRETFRMAHILRRVRPSFTGAVNLIGNVAYRRFVRRLHEDPVYARPYASAPAPEPRPAHAEVMPCRT